MIFRPLPHVFAVISLYLFEAEAVQLKQKPLAEYISYTSVPGYFLEDLNSTNTTTFDFVRRYNLL
jgi:hypothetical protein